MRQWVTVRSLLFISHTGADNVIAEELGQRLKTEGYDVYLDFHPEDGTAGGRNWERDIYRQLRRADGVILLASNAAMASHWCFAERTIARLLSKPIFPLRLLDAPPPEEFQEISEIQAIDFTAGDAYPRLWRSLREAHFDPGNPLTWDKQRSPYPGLQAFAGKDAGVFFGRDKKIEELWEKLTTPLMPEATQVVSIVGPSGSGKSSLLRAGLLPRLQGPNWIVLEPFVPGTDPTAKLAQSIAAELVGARSEAELKNQLSAPNGLATIVDEIFRTRSGQQNLVIPIDQAEELVTRTSAGERRAFLRLLEQAQAADDRLWVVSTLRLEFLSQAPDLAGLCDGGQTVVVQPLEQQMLLDVIKEPAKRAGIDFPEDLARQMVEDTAGGDALPLLAYTLEKLYRNRRNSLRITSEDYQATGTVSDALTHQADRTAADLTQQGYGPLVLRTLQKLADVRDTGEVVRRRISWSDLTPDQQMVVERFTKARLLKKDKGTVEVAHEALLRQWEPLSQWIDRESASLRIRSELSKWAAEWDQNGRDSEDGSYLQHGGRLDDWLEWADDHPTEVGHVEGDFLQASRDFRNRRVNELQGALDKARSNQDLAEQRTADLAQINDELSKKTAQLTDTNAALEKQTAALSNSMRKEQARTKVAIGVAIITVIALIGAVYFRQEAKDRLHQATARKLVAEAETMLAGTRSDGDFRIMEQLLAAQLVWPDVNDAGALLDAVIQRRSLAKINQTSDAVSGTAVSADGTRIAAGEKDDAGTVEIWDASSLKPIGHPIKTGHGPVYVVGFIGQKVVAASNDGSLGIWDENGQVGPVNLSPRPGLRSLVVTSDQKRIIAGDDEGDVRVFNASTAESDGPSMPACTKHNGEHNQAWSLAVTGHTLAAGCQDGTISIWDLSKRQPTVKPLSPGQGPIWTVAFSPQGNRMAAAGSSDAVLVWDNGTDVPAVGPIVLRGVLSVAFSPDGDRLATGGVDDTVRVWDVRQRGTPTPLNTLVGHQGDVQSVAFVGDRVLSGGDDQTVRLWDTTNIDLPSPGHGQPDVCERISSCVETLAFRGQTIISVTREGSRRLWNADGAPSGQPLPPASSATSTVASSDDGQRFVTGAEDSSVRTWDSLSNEPASRVITVAHGAVKAVALSGQQIASFSLKDGAVREWNIVDSRQVTPPMATGQATVTALTYSSDGKRLASAADDGSLRIWDASTGTAITPSMTGDLDEDHNAREITGVAFSPNGQLVVSGASGDDSVRIWDVTTGKQVAMLGKHEQDVTSVAFSRDGRFVLSGAADGTVRVWDPATREPVGETLQTGGNVTSVAFSPDDQRIVAGLVDGTVRVWPGPAVWRQDLCAKLVDNMNREQWHNWVGAGIDFQEVCPHLPQQLRTDAPG